MKRLELSIRDQIAIAIAVHNGHGLTPVDAADQIMSIVEIVKRDAWDEGYVSGWNDFLDGTLAEGARAVNPYCATTPEPARGRRKKPTA